MAHTYILLVRRIALVIFIALFASNSQAQYCTPTYYYSNCFYNYMYIQSVSSTGGITNISNANTGCGGSTSFTYYSNKTHMAAPGATVSLSITNNPNYSCQYKVFVDFNGDNDFVDAGEEVASATINWSATQTLTFTIPTTTSPGVKRMRIRNRYAYSGGTLGPCNFEYYGEAEDYNLEVCTPISISSHPVSKSVCINGSTTFTVLPANATAYQWQVDNGTGYVNINPNSYYSGTTTSTLNINASSPNLNGNKYRVNVTGCGTASSNFGQLTIIDSTTVGAQSVSGSYCDGINTELNIGVSGTPASTMKWQVDRGIGFVDVPNEFPYTGFNNDTLLITPLADSMNGFVFRCVVGGTCNYDTTQNITITVDRIPEFVTDPTDILVSEGEDGSFKISSLGKAAFRWQAKTPKGASYVSITDNANYSGALTSELTVKNPSLAQSGYMYRCLMTGLGNCNSVKDTTEAAMLKVRNPLGVGTVAEGRSNIALFPNPARGKDEVKIRVDNSIEMLNVTVTDKLGRVVSKTELPVAANTAVLNITKLTPGNYTITIEDVQNNKTETIKFVKQ